MAACNPRRGARREACRRRRLPHHEARPAVRVERAPWPRAERTEYGGGTSDWGGVSKGVAEPPARGNTQLGEHFVQVVLRGPGADEELSADLGVGAPLGR